MSLRYYFFPYYASKSALSAGYSRRYFIDFRIPGKNIRFSIPMLKTSPAAQAISFPPKLPALRCFNEGGSRRKKKK
jgi:hypothetical protein